MYKFVILLLMPAAAFSIRAVRYVEYNPPVIYPSNDHMTVVARTRYRLTCEGNKEVVWHLPHKKANIGDRVSISYSNNPKQKNNYTSNLEIRDMVYTDTGSYRCSFKGSEDATSIDANTYIHLYV